MEFNLRLYKSFYQYELYIFQHAKFNILGMHLVDTILEIPQGSKKKKKIWVFQSKFLLNVSRKSKIPMI